MILHFTLHRQGFVALASVWYVITSHRDALILNYNVLFKKLHNTLKFLAALLPSPYDIYFYVIIIIFIVEFYSGSISIR